MRRSSPCLVSLCPWAVSSLVSLLRVVVVGWWGLVSMSGMFELFDVSTVVLTGILVSSGMLQLSCVARVLVIWILFLDLNRLIWRAFL